ncbi:MAG: NERD domain-containing protein [Nitrososphaerota archaeon]|jgi:HEAT repeat protein|nr:NERD domain-containing protein [Nitrososphaerota archaeon]
MSFRVYSCGPPDDTHERRQVDQLLPFLNREFGESQVECSILLNIGLPIQDRNQIDAIVIKENRFIVLEFKDIGGRILADCATNSNWTIEDAGKVWYYNRENPYLQVRRERRLLGYYLRTGFLSTKEIEGLLGSEDEGPLTPTLTVASNVAAWVVVRPGSEPRVMNVEKQVDRWFKVVPLDEVSRELRLEASRRQLISPDRVEVLASSLGAAFRPDWREWYLAPNEPSRKDAGTGPRFDYVDLLLGSTDSDEVLKGIRDVERFDLRYYLPQVVTLSSSESTAVALTALNLLDSWGSGIPEERALEWLTHESPGRCKWAWSFVISRKTRAALPILEQLAHLSNGKTRSEAIGLLADYSTRDAATILLHIAQDSLRQESPSRETQWMALARGMGQPGFSEAIPVLTHVINLCYRDVEREWNNWEMGVVECALEALGKIGDTAAAPALTRFFGVDGGSLDPLLIQAIGRLREAQFVPVVAPYLSSKLEDTREAAIEALRTMGGEKAFDALWQSFEGEARGSERPFRISQALKQMDPRLFETRVLQVLEGGKELLGTVDNLLWCLTGNATARSAAIVWPFLSNHETYMEALNILSLPEVFPTIAGRVEDLAKSNNEIERAAHVYLSVPDLNTDGVHSMADHEKDTSPLVRSAVVEIYSASKSLYAESRLGIMVFDADPEVQQDAVLALLLHAREWLDRSLVVSEDRVLRQADILTHQVGVLAVQQSDVAQRMDMSVKDLVPFVIRGSAIQSVGPILLSDLGMAIAITERQDPGERLILVLPGERHPYFREQEIKKWLFRLATTISPSVVRFEVDGNPSPAFVKLGEKAKRVMEMS